VLLIDKILTTNDVINPRSQMRGLYTMMLSVCLSVRRLKRVHKKRGFLKN